MASKSASDMMNYSQSAAVMTFFYRAGGEFCRRGESQEEEEYVCARLIEFCQMTIKMGDWKCGIRDVGEIVVSNIPQNGKWQR